MFPDERRAQILRVVQEQGRAAVADLAEQFAVSPMTIRRDLELLERQGLIGRSHGGAIPPYLLATEIPYQTKLAARVEEKNRIGAAAAALIQPGETVILDSGSTTLAVAQHIQGISGLTAVTNDLMVAVELANRGVSMVCTGGLLQASLYTLIGPPAENVLSTLRVDKAFLGADALDVEAGLTNRTLMEVAVKKAMIRAARQVIVVADASKLGAGVFAQVCPLQAIHTVVTNREAPADFVAAARQAGIDVILC